MLGRRYFDFLSIAWRCGLARESNFIGTFRREYGKSSTSHMKAYAMSSTVDEELQDIFKFRDTKISNWIIEVRDI